MKPRRNAAEPARRSKSTLEAELARAHEELAQLRGELAALEGAYGAAQEELIQWRDSAVEAQSLRETLELMGRRETELRLLVLETHEQLLRRDEEIEATIAATLRSHALVSESVPSPRLRYQEVVARVRELVRTTVPANTTVAVVSKGDEALLELDGRRGWHLPQGEGGRYAGYHPADSVSAIAQLEELRARGAEFLLIPAPSFWWLDHYAEFAQHLESRYRLIHRSEACALYRLGRGGLRRTLSRARPRSSPTA